MIPIRLTPENKQAIEDALKAVNGKAMEHTYSYLWQLNAIANMTELDLLNLLKSKNALVGAKMISTSGEPTAKSYKYARKATTITLERQSTGWVLTSIAEAKIYAQGGKTTYILTPEQDAHAVELFRRQYTVQALT